jgi:hypothetical protein
LALGARGHFMVKECQEPLEAQKTLGARRHLWAPEPLKPRNP